MKKFILSALLGIVVLSACAKSPDVTAMPDSSSTSETQISPTALATFSIFGILKESAVLYSLPLNNHYYALGELPKGTNVDLSGSFGDFVSIKTNPNGKALQGYISKTVLEDVPSELRELTLEEIPWRQVPFLFGFMYNQDLDIVGLAEDEISINNPLPSTYEIKGAPIRVESAFRITASFEAGDTNLSSIQLKGFKPNPSSPIYRLDIASFQGKVMLLFRDGSKEMPTSVIKTELRSDQPFSVVFSDPSGKGVQVYDAEQNLVTTVDVTKLPDSNFPDGLFPNQRFYLGATCSNASKVTISSFTLEEAPTGKMMEPPQIGLKSFAESHDISMGNVLEVNILDNDKYIDILQKDFELIYISEFSAAYLRFWRGPGDYNWAVIDPVVEYALQNGYVLRANHLTMGEKSSVPQWLLESNYSRDEYIRILESYVKDVVTHYRGRIAQYSIANEAVSRSSTPTADFWNDKIGPEYIEMVFRWAREADPNAMLILNDIDNEDPRDERSRMITEKMYLTVKDLKAKGTPIDAIGMQMHLLLPWSPQTLPRKDKVIETMRKFGSLGVDVYITEMDVDLHIVSGTQEEKWKYQADVYRDMISACLESGVCKGFATWGTSDATSWINCVYDWCIKHTDGDPLLYDQNYDPKPSYFAVQEVLQNGPIPSSSPSP